MPTQLISFKDAVNAAALDPNAKVAVFYADGLYANRAEVAARCPHAALYGITVHGLTGPGIFACDCEAGDLTVGQAESWVAEQVLLDVRLICVYASLDTWERQGLLAALHKYGKRIKRWVADWNGDPHSMPGWADADQYTSLPNVDLDVARADFFKDTQPAPLIPRGAAHFAGTFSLNHGIWDVHGTPWPGVHFGPQHAPEVWDSAELQVCRQGPRRGQWRIRGIPADSKPLG
jgi:hypothetical protein